MRSRSREFNVFGMSALDLFASALGAFILIAVVLMPYFLRVDRQVVEQITSERDQAQAELSATRQRLERAEGALQQTKDELQQAKDELQQAKDELQQCQQREAACEQARDELGREVERLLRELAAAKSAAEDARSETEAAKSEIARAKSAAEQAKSELRDCQAELNVCEEKLTRTFLAVVIQWATPKHDVDLHIIDAAGKEFYFDERTIPGRPGKLSVDTTGGPGVEIWEVPTAPTGEYRVLYDLYERHGNPDDAIVQGGVYYRDGHIRFRERRLTTPDYANAILVAVVTVNDDGSVEVAER